MSGYIISSEWYEWSDDDYLHPLDRLLIGLHLAAMCFAFLALAYFAVSLLNIPADAKVFIYVFVISSLVVIADELKEKLDALFLIPTTIIIKVLYFIQIVGSLSLALLGYLSVDLPVDPGSAISGVVIALMIRAYFLDSQKSKIVEEG